jgi:DNA-binding NtrC family response regulator
MGLLNPTISADATAFLATQEWRGNVRELENVVRKALLLARRYLQAQRTVTIIGLEDVRAALAKSEIPRPASNQPLSAYVSDLLTRAERGELVDAQSAFMAVAERELYAQAIRLAAGNQAKAAKWLGVSRPTMREKLLQHGLHPDSDSSASTR